MTVSEMRILPDDSGDAYGAADFEIVGACEILWSGWQGDTRAALVQLGDGRRV